MPFSSTLSHCFSLSSPFPSVLSVAYSPSVLDVHLSSLSPVPPSSSSIRLADSSSHSRTSSEIEFISRFYKLCSLVLRGRRKFRRIDRIPHQNHSQTSAHFSCILAADCNVAARRSPFLTRYVFAGFSNYSRYYISLYTADS